ncbi:glycosyltransferase family 2 protein [Hymenobacter ruber]
MSQESASNPPLVSVMMVTYNQEAYVATALDSILNQEVDFDYEIVIGEDYSTDRTRAIISEYQQRYGSRIRPLFHEKNLGVSRNWEFTAAQCRGKYVALLEGDDYWTNPHKLQKQVDFMESHPDFSMCFHNARVLYEGGANPPASHLMTQIQKAELTLDEVTRDWHIATGSVMYRRAMLPELPAWVHDSVVVDLPLLASLAKAGRVGFLNEEMGVYRVNAGGVSQTAKKEAYLLGLVRMYARLDEHLGYGQHRNFMVKTADAYLALASSLNTQQRHAEARRYLLRSLRSRVSVGVVPRSNSFKALAISLLPGLYNRFYPQRTGI